MSVFPRRKDRRSHCGSQALRPRLTHPRPRRRGPDSHKGSGGRTRVRAPAGPLGRSAVPVTAGRARVPAPPPRARCRVPP
eukprot:351042-Rhodomonas_salina.2